MGQKIVCIIWNHARCHKFIKGKNKPANYLRVCIWSTIMKNYRFCFMQHNLCVKGCIYTQKQHQQKHRKTAILNLNFCSFLLCFIFFSLSWVLFSSVHALSFFAVGSVAAAALKVLRWRYDLWIIINKNVPDTGTSGSFTLFATNLCCEKCVGNHNNLFLLTVHT